MQKDTPHIVKGSSGSGTTSPAMQEIMAALVSGCPFMPTTKEGRQTLRRLQELGVVPVVSNARIGLLPAPAEGSPPVSERQLLTWFRARRAVSRSHVSSCLRRQVGARLRAERARDD